MTIAPPAPKPDRKVIFVNRFYAPDLSATSQILTDVAEALAKTDHTVTVLTSRMSYDGNQTYRPSERLKGVNIHRIWTTRFGRGSTIGRAFDYLTFYLSISLSLLFRLKKNDVLVAKTDPPMLSIPLGFIARLKSAHLINWLQDVFPEVATELGVTSSDNVLARALRSLRNRSLRHAAANVAIGERMKERIIEMGVESDRTTIIENFVDDRAIIHTPDHSPALREEWGLAPDDFVIGYSGNLGRAHDLDTMLDAATALQEKPQIKFLFVGGGFLRERLNQEIATRNLENVLLRPYQPRARLPESLRLPNLHWASLNPKLEGYIVPSKAYGIAAAGRPLLMVGDEDGEIGRFIKAYDFGICVAPGDHARVRKIISDLASDPARLDQLGQNARRFIDERACMQLAFKRWDDLLRNVTANS